MAASVVQYGRRRGSSKKVSSADEANRMIQPPDLRQVTVLPKAEWLRIQDRLHQVNTYKDSIREAAQQRQAMHLRSKEVVKSWSNTIAGQRQKKLEAKKIREQIEEEQRKLTDIEEAKYQEQKRKEAIAKARAQQYYQTDRVKGFHRVLLLTEVLKEREAQIELKKRIQSTSKDMDKEFINTTKSREDEALRQEQQKALEKKLERQAVAEDLTKQIKENCLAKEREKLEDKKEGEEIQHLRQLYLWEQRMETEKKVEQKRNIMQAHLEHVSKRDIIRAIETQKQEVEEERRQLFLSAKQNMMKLRKDKETELFREAQVHRDRIMDKLTATLQEQTINEEERVTKAVAERDAQLAQQQQDEEEKKAAMLKSITVHREAMRQEKEQRDMVAHQNAQDMLQAKKEADRIFLEKQQLKAQQMKEDARILQDLYANQMAEKCARHQQLRREQHDLEAKNEGLIAEEEKQFQQYTKHIINAAAEAERNVLPLRKAARDGIGGGLGPIYGAVRASYLVQDITGAQMPKYVSGTTQNIKELNEAVDIHDAKKRLGFTW
ncbi:cilia- and flagella- associated protein 210 [Centroberyx affinis]|uniref:cilia- and flagella- associated protein 210 n=1 Tax=Centroberyx affinis TaxID=166261 RepID=UPI003A5BF671